MPSSHHVALENMDIIREILSKLVEDTGPGEQPGYLYHTKDLLAMTLCCKAFERPSLDLLWSGMTSLVPLLKILAGEAKINGPLVRDMSSDFLP